MKESETTHFGYEQVAAGDKAGRVAGVFDSVADRYDVMNDLMSFGLHRVWKRLVTVIANVRPGQQVLDIAGGTGDLAAIMSKHVGANGMVVLSDINASMLNKGRDRLIDRGLVGNIRCVQANAESLPFADNSFDVITMAFGLRNVTDQNAALRSLFRVLKPGGRLLVLEFSTPVYAGLRKVYDRYSFSVLPRIGKLVAKDADSYRYLAESIRMHPDQETLQQMMDDAGFGRTRYFNLLGGVVAVHSGYKL